MNREKIIKLFCLYTALSIGISVLAWCAVLMEFVYVSPAIIAGISSMDWRVAACIYVLGSYLVYCLLTGKPFVGVFALYASLQAGAVVTAIVSQGMLYFPAAGSQGTLPAIAITMTALVYILTTARDALKV